MSYSTDSFDSVIPAKQRRISIPLKELATSATASLTENSSETSTFWKSTVGLSPLLMLSKCASAFAPISSSTSKMASLSTPCSRSALAQTRPSPWAPPVTGDWINSIIVVEDVRTHRLRFSRPMRSERLRVPRGSFPGGRDWGWVGV